MRKVAVSGTQLVISPQIRQFQGGDGQLGPAGLRAHILQTPALYHRSIFMTPALWVNVKGLDVTVSQRYFHDEVAVAGCLISSRKRHVNVWGLCG